MFLVPVPCKFLVSFFAYEKIFHFSSTCASDVLSVDSLNRGFCSEQGSDQARLNDHGEMVTPTRSGDSGFGL